jgi:hypothetical protein
VFNDDQELKRVLETVGEFSTISIDRENEDVDVEIKVDILFQIKLWVTRL